MKKMALQTFVGLGVLVVSLAIFTAIVELFSNLNFINTTGSVVGVVFFIMVILQTAYYIGEDIIK